MWRKQTLSLVFWPEVFTDPFITWSPSTLIHGQVIALSFFNRVIQEISSSVQILYLFCWPTRTLGSLMPSFVIMKETYLTGLIIFQNLTILCQMSHSHISYILNITLFHFHNITINDNFMHGNPRHLKNDQIYYLLFLAYMALLWEY